MIYRNKYKAEYEARFHGEFVAIDVATEKAYHAPNSQGAYTLARQDSPTGIFHLLKVGEAGAFRVSYSSDGNLDRLFRQFRPVS